MTDSDSEIILHLAAQSAEETVLEALIDALHQVEGAASLMVLTPDMMMAVRDPYGFRPLVMGKMDGKIVFASESTCFDLIGAEYVDELQPGEVRYIDADGLHVIHPFNEKPHHQCIFEHVYFARPDSVIFGAQVHNVRMNLGRILSEEVGNDLELDMIVPVPDGGNYIALGYSQHSGIPYQIGLVRNHYIGRTFIEPEQGIRDFGVKVKLNPIKHLIEGKKIGLIDDSIVRGTTSRKIIEMMRRAGAEEVHYLIGSPPYISPCYYGIDTPERDKLIANNYTIEQITKQINADSIHYLSLKGLLRSVHPDSEHYCVSCFTGQYPVDTTDTARHQLNLWHRRKIKGEME